MTRIGWVVVLVVVIAPAAAHADGGLWESRRPTPFDQGHFGFSGAIGEETAFGHTYVGVGLGAGYYVLDGLEAGLFARHEFGDPPGINEVSPSLGYVAQPLVYSWPVIPYVDAFYNHWFIGSPGTDLDTVGARAGLLRLSGRAIFGLGIGYEHVISACVRDCDYVYPDVTIGFTL